MLEKGFSVPPLLQPDLPPAVSWLPLPAGWWWLAGALAALLVLLALWRTARWRRNRWRREARQVLRHDNSIDSWLRLIKRVRLVHQPRAQVSELSLSQLLQELPLDAATYQRLFDGYCQPDNSLSPDEMQRLRSQLRRWLEALPDV